MKLFMSPFLILVLLGMSLFSCDKLEDKPEGEVEICLLESFELDGGEFSSAIDESTAVPESRPFIPYSGIKSYHRADHAFKLTDAYRDTVINTGFPVSPTAFGVYANGELIYTGYFIPAYSSVGCAWTTIDPLFVSSGNRLDVKLGYPAPFEGVDVPDRRNDPRILAIFDRDGKLK